MSKFNAKTKIGEITEWICHYFEKNGNPNTCAVVGVSGGCDSSVVLKLCVDALGADRVIAVLMPNGAQNDIHYAYAVCEKCKIPSHNICEINIKSICSTYADAISEFKRNMPDRNIAIMETNYPARIRMSVLYGISALRGGRVANTCNLSEDWIGYSTKYGDSAGDFSPLANFTKTEVKLIGKELGLPKFLVEKVPSDGLSGRTDEENFGFTYSDLDKYIREGICDSRIKERIDELHYANIHKLKVIPKFYYRPDREKRRNADEVASD